MPMEYKVGLFFAWLYVAMAFFVVYGSPLCDLIQRKAKGYIARFKAWRSREKAPKGLPVLE